MCIPMCNMQFIVHIIQLLFIVKTSIEMFQNGHRIYIKQQLHRKCNFYRVLKYFKELNTIVSSKYYTFIMRF